MGNSVMSQHISWHDYNISHWSGPMEQNIVDAIKTYVIKHGGKVIKIQGTAFQEAGTPDLIGGLGGVPFVCEVKQPGDPHPISKIQRARLKEWAIQGYLSMVARSPEEFVYWYDMYLTSFQHGMVYGIEHG